MQFLPGDVGGAIELQLSYSHVSSRQTLTAAGSVMPFQHHQSVNMQCYGVENVFL